MDLAAMGRVWYLEAAARARMGDAAGLLDTILRVCKAGRETGYYWRERYGPKGGYGAEEYCEYPANLIRIVQRFLFGLQFQLDGALAIAPTATPEFWDRGFSQQLEFRGRTLDYRMLGGAVSGTYAGSGPQRLEIRTSTAKIRHVLLPPSSSPRAWKVTL
jgi:hypothetical protein